MWKRTAKDVWHTATMTVGLYLAYYVRKNNLFPGDLFSVAPSTPQYVGTIIASNCRFIVKTAGIMHTKTWSSFWPNRSMDFLRMLKADYFNMSSILLDCVCHQQFAIEHDAHIHLWLAMSSSRFYCFQSLGLGETHNSWILAAMFNTTLLHIWSIMMIMHEQNLHVAWIVDIISLADITSSAILSQRDAETPRPI